MHHISSNDFYIFEPVRQSEGQFCILFCFFIWRGIMHARVWPLVVVQDELGRQGWIIEKSDEYKCQADALYLTILQILHSDYVPDICEIWGIHILFAMLYSTHVMLSGMRTTFAGGIEHWLEPLINPWCTKAQGKRVLSMPFWLYCDDTSGNRSKKWNEHNSFLMTPYSLSVYLQCSPSS